MGKGTGCAWVDVERYVFKNSSAVWSSPAFPVRKPHVSPITPLLDRMRLCVDLRAVSRLTEPMALPLPRRETVVERLGGQLYLGSVDVLNSRTPHLSAPPVYCTTHLSPAQRVRTR